MNVKKRQSGFALLEVVLAIVIIAVASFGIYKLYSISTLKSKLSAEEDFISQVYNAATQMAFSTAQFPTTVELQTSGKIPIDAWTEDLHIVAPFGTIKYLYDTESKEWGQIRIFTVPRGVVNQLASDMQKLADVYVGQTAYTSDYVFTADSYTINIFFPKGKYVP